MKAFISRRLNHHYIRFVCILIIVVVFIALTVSFATSVDGRTRFGTQLGNDFGAFYTAGKIFNKHSRAQIYDATLQDQLYRQFFPNTPPDTHLPYVNAPFFILPFTLLARLPYAWAYFLWLIISIGLYFAGLRLLRPVLDSFSSEMWTTAMLLSFSFMPFLVECLAGGQTSAVGFFAIALGINLEHRNKYFLAGAALSLLAYKPTLLFLIIPMLIFMRRFSALAGFVAGLVALSVISIVSVGWEGSAGYLNNLLFFTEESATSTSVFRTWKYVDINSFARLLFSNFPVMRWLVVGLVFVLVMPLLLLAWWHYQRGDRDQKDLIWAMTLTWTMVLNIYVGIYDTTLIVPGLLLTANALLSQGNVSKVRLFKVALVIVYVVPWFTQPLARLIYIQVFTLVLTQLGNYQFRWARLRALSSASGSSA